MLVARDLAVPDETERDRRHSGLTRDRPVVALADQRIAQRQAEGVGLDLEHVARLGRDAVGED